LHQHSTSTAGLPLKRRARADVWVAISLAQPSQHRTRRRARCEEIAAYKVVAAKVAQLGAGLHPACLLVRPAHRLCCTTASATPCKPSGPAEPPGHCSQQCTSCSTRLSLKCSSFVRSLQPPRCRAHSTVQAVKSGSAVRHGQRVQRRCSSEPHLSQRLRLSKPPGPSPFGGPPAAAPG
jgi:hypothetical protein